MNDEEFKEFHRNLKDTELHCYKHDIDKRVTFTEVEYKHKIFAKANTMICLDCRSDFFESFND